MDSSPTTSPSTSRFFSTFPSGPPKRTYGRTRGAVAQTRARSSVNQPLEETGEDDETPVPSSSRRQATRKTSPRSSPTPTSRRSSSRLASSSSQTGTQLPVGQLSSSQLTGLSEDDDQEGEGLGEIVAELPSPSRKVQPARDEAVSLQGEKKRKRASIPESLVPAPSRRSTRKQTTSAASIRSTEDTKEVERPRTPPPSAKINGKSSAREAPSTPPRSVRPTLPTTPSSSSPRDFAALYAAVSPGGTLESGTFASPRAARILAKSQSSGAVLDSPSKLRQRLDSVQRQESFGSSMSAEPSTPSKRLGKTQSMPLTPSQRSPSIATTDPDPSAMLIQPTVPEGQGSGGRAKRIYGRNRTVIAEQREASQEAPTLEETLSKESYADLRKRYEVDPGSAEVSADLLSGALAARPPESVNDMRSKGGNRRYMDETGYLLDGIIEDGASKGFKKSSSVDLLANMLQDEWLAKMKICGQTERVWAALSHARDAGDDVMYAVCLLALYIVVLSGDGIEAIIRSDAESCIGMILGELDQRNGILDPDSKVKQTPIVVRVREISQGVSSRASRSISTRGVASAILAAISEPPILPLALEALETSRAVIKVSKAILPEAKILGDRFQLYESGLDLLPADGSVDFCRLKDQLSVLKALVLSLDNAREELLGHEIGLARALLQILVGAVGLALQPEFASGVDAVSAIVHILKIFVSMMGVPCNWDVALLQTRGAFLALGRIIRYRHRLARLAGEDDPEAEHQDAEKGSGVISQYELLSLASTIVASAAAEGVEFASSLAMLYLAPDCVTRPGCLRLCYCVAAEPFALYLVELYIDYEQKSAMPERNFIGAYLGLLVTKIIVSASPPTERIIDKLPGPTRVDKLKGLSASLARLGGYEAVLHREVGDVGGQEEDGLDEEDSVVKQVMAELELIIHP